MARIPEADIERLKNEVSLVRLIESQGHTLTKRGRDWVMRCVFHEDATASLVVTESKNLYHCFGCNAAGSVIDWVMKTQGVSLPHAVQLLRNGAPLEGGQAGDKAGVKRSHQRHLPPLVADTADEQALLVQVTDYYHSALKQSPDALAYLQSRGLVSSEMIDVFKLGYADRTLTYRLPPGQNVAGREIRTRLQALGVYRSSGHEHLNGCIVVPVIGMEDGAMPEQAGQVMQLYGRRIAPNGKIPADQPRHMYLPRPLKGVWNEAALVASREIILCESLIDAMTFWCAGFRNVIAAYGVNGFTLDHWQAVKRYGVTRMLIAYDRDDAGNAAADKLAGEFMDAGIECFRVLFPKGMDANDYALKVQPAAKSLGLLLHQAQWMGKGKRPGVTVIEPAPDALEETSAAKEEMPGEIERAEPADVPPTSTPAAVADTSSLAAMPAPELPPVPAMPAVPAGEQAEQSTIKGELLLVLGDRHWRIRGWQKNLSPETMRVNVQVRRDASDRADAAYYVDTLDVYSAKQRMVYIKQAALELGVQDEAIKRDLGRVLLKLEGLQDGAIQEALAPKDAAPTLSDGEQAAALVLLKAPDLTRRLVADMERCGVVGEATNLLAGYLAAVSRKLDAPLAVLIQSSSAAGKSSLMDAVLNLVPAEERIQYSAMTGQSLFYLGETDLQHKILAIAEEEGVRQAAYALKLLQSDGELTIASTGKDDTTGNLITKQYRVKGPVMLMLTTTAIDVDEELLNRCLVLTVNESREQTQAIHARQRAKQTLAGLMMDNDKQSIMALHQNAQRLLKAVHVVNPYADRLTFLDDKTRMRRDHMKYLTLIRAIALLHQYQRPVRSILHRDVRLEYIEVTKDDIALANKIAHEVLGRTLDELPPQPRRLLTMLQAWVAERCAALDMQPAAFRFTRKEVREVTRWGDTQLKLYFARLVELEYLIAHFNGRRQSTDYELLYDGKGDSNPHLMGLIDPATLEKEHDNGAEWSDKNSEWSASGRGVVGMQSGCGRVLERQAVPGVEADSAPSVPKTRSKRIGTSASAAVVDAVVG
ncbi:CHC2 zinc finger domain-containing protein [Massilia sp. DJPM01]|uniref:CHC2 zinc finger domain-containing protein n=1 Tax=Massilia sp. DJPM01 TaxID=3024404 RepID=UPI00259DFABF|nr:CHC2 zinc finger domain-containing protein [Massilia sp. DJPM01]MDM5182049.1 CHC2 zinc finger domain-containing protein [Massilia sp. DJPM01]